MGTDKDSALLGECKRMNDKVDLGKLKTLVEGNSLFLFEETHFYLFSKSGFAKGWIDKAADVGNVSLVSYGNMLRQGF